MIEFHSINFTGINFNAKFNCVQKMDRIRCR